MVMKTSNQQNKQPKQVIAHTPRPEIRDNLDSRKNEEQDGKGDDTTHNKKVLKNDKLKKKS